MSQSSGLSDAEPLDPARLRPHYSAFLKSDRILLTGHSHQAWPDVAREGLLEAWAVAAEQVDDKWGPALACAEEIRATIAADLSTPERPVAADSIALAGNSHELVVRFLSCLPAERRGHLVTTDGEFYSMARQLNRLREEGVEITAVPALPVERLAERVIAAIKPHTGAVLVSSVLFGSGHVVPHLAEIAAAAHRVGALPLFDAYHAFKAVPFTVADLGVDPVFVTAGGYKYAQWGEGVCWMRIPEGPWRPACTGWFAEFGDLEAPRRPGEVSYARSGAIRFAGSTYDPSSHFRARAVIRFFAEQGMTGRRLRALSQRQTGLIIELAGDLDLITPRDPDARGGFVALRIPDAAEVVRRLRAQGIFVDARGDVLRLGPAPYVLDEDINKAMEALRTAVAAR